MKYFDAFHSLSMWLSQMLLLVFLLCFSLSIVADTLDEKKHALGQLKKNIDSLETRIEHTKEKITTEIDALKDIELEIAEVLLSLTDLHKKIAQIEQEKTLLKKTRQKLTEEINKQKAGLANSARLYYGLGYQPELKLLLSQNTPQHTSRMLTYFRYVLKNQAKRIESLQVSQQELKEADQKLDAKKQLTSNLLAQQDAKKDTLEAQQNTRKDIVTTLNQQLSNSQEKLEYLAQNEAALTKLIERLKNEQNKFKNAQIEALKGKLRMPTKGNIANVFGQQKHPNSSILWEGIFIEAEEETTVYPVHNGTVIFADWLRGYGLLTIIQHNENYMTLYAHNKALYKNVGDSVSPGDVIGLVGKNTIDNKSGLYFELRHKGKPLNPVAWLE